jgi:hypothetical protein
MNIYPAITFFHIAGAITLFISWALKYDYFKSVNQLSTINEDMTVSRKFKNYSRLGSIAVFVTLVSGFWLMVTNWGFSAWIIMSLVSIGLIIFTEVLFSRKVASAKPDGFRMMFFLINSIRLQIAIGTGIIALMVFKTSHLFSSILIVLIFLIAGLCVIWVFPPLKKMKHGFDS